MIVNRSHAEEALAILNADGSLAPVLDGLLEQQVKELYREACKTAHPDGGGTMEKFAAVDRAKHLLLKWLEKQTDEPALPPMGVKCPSCAGRGYRMSDVQRGFKITSLRVQCRKCRGSGELGVEHDQGDFG